MVGVLATEHAMSRTVALLTLGLTAPALAQEAPTAEEAPAARPMAPATRPASAAEGAETKGATRKNPKARVKLPAPPKPLPPPPPPPQGVQGDAR